MSIQSVYGPGGFPQSLDMASLSSGMSSSGMSHTSGGAQTGSLGRIGSGVTDPRTDSSGGVVRSEAPFASLMRSMLEQTDQQQRLSEREVQRLVSGETDSIHDVVLTASRADLAFRLMMEIRNRLIASYQEVMRMQV